jgi:hypothetical protein
MHPCETSCYLLHDDSDSVPVAGFVKMMGIANRSSNQSCGQNALAVAASTRSNYVLDTLLA